MPAFCRHTCGSEIGMRFRITTPRSTSPTLPSVPALAYAVLSSSPLLHPSAISVLRSFFGQIRTRVL